MCTALDSDPHVWRTYGDGAYTVSLPTPPAEQVQPEPDIDPDVELSPRPPKPDVSFRFSATDLASLYREYGELQFDEDTGTIYVDETDDSETSPEIGTVKRTQQPERPNRTAVQQRKQVSKRTASTRAYSAR